MISKSGLTSADYQREFDSYKKYNPGYSIRDDRFQAVLNALVRAENRIRELEDAARKEAI